MKRYFSIFLIFLFFLCSCNPSHSSSVPFTSSDYFESESYANGSSSEPESQYTKESSSDIETESSTIPVSTLLDVAQPLNASGSLSYIPNELLETTTYPSFFYFCGNLLISTQHFEVEEENAGNEGTKEATCIQTLKLLDLNNGSLKSELTIQQKGFITLQVCSNQLAVINMPAGRILFLDETLNITKEYSITPDFSYSTCYVSFDCTTLYQINWNTNSIIALDLRTNTTYPILENALQISPINKHNNYVTLSYINAETVINMTACLNLEAKTLENTPFDGSFFSFSHYEDFWLGCLNSDMNTYFLGNDQNPIVLSCENGGFMLDPYNEFIIFHSSSGDHLSLYTLDGTFISSCSLTYDESLATQNQFWQDENEYYSIYPDTIIWSDTYHGYFLIANGNIQNKLLFWDVTIPSTGSNLTYMTLEEWNTMTIEPGTAVSSSLYERAQMLSQRYNVKILITDQCDTTISNFTTNLICNETQISAGLDVLEEALSLYPENFFQQLCYGNIDEIEIQLVGALHPSNSFDPTSSYAGFTTTMDNKHLVVINLLQSYASTYFHEFSHLIDKKIAFVSLYKENALFSEQDWKALCPENFSYLESYEQLPTKYLSSGYEQYFIDPYSQINATEDRARILEISMQGLNLAFLQNTPLQQKLLYYSQCIRECFDTTNWPETTLWEKTLVDCGLWPE